MSGSITEQFCDEQLRVDEVAVLQLGFFQRGAKVDSGGYLKKFIYLQLAFIQRTTCRAIGLRSVTASFDHRYSKVPGFRIYAAWHKM